MSFTKKSRSQASESTLQSGFKHKFTVKISPLLAPKPHQNLDDQHVITCGSQKNPWVNSTSTSSKKPKHFGWNFPIKKKNLSSPMSFMMTSIPKLCISKSLVRAEPTFSRKEKGRRKLTPPVFHPFCWCLRNHCYWKVASSCTIDSLVWRHERLLLASAQTFGWEVERCGSGVIETCGFSSKSFSIVLPNFRYPAPDRSLLVESCQVDDISTTSTSKSQFNGW